MRYKKQENVINKKKQKVEKVTQNNIKHFELIFENSDSKTTHFPHFRKHTTFVLKYIFPDSLSVVSSLFHVVSMNYTDTHKIYIYASDTSDSIKNNCNNNSKVTVTSICFIIGTFSKYALQLDPTHTAHSLKKNSKQISLFKDIQDSDKTTGENFYIHVPSFITNSDSMSKNNTKSVKSNKTVFIKKYKHLITELITDIPVSIKKIKHLLNINIFHYRNNKIDMNLVHTLSEINICNSPGASFMPLSSIYTSRDHSQIIKYKDAILNILSMQVFPVRFHGYDANLNTDIYKGLFKYTNLLNKLARINKAHSSDLEYLYTLSIIIEYVHIFTNQQNSLNELWLQKGLQRYLYTKLRGEIHGRSFVESLKQGAINILELFDAQQHSLQHIKLDTDVMCENLIRVLPTIITNIGDIAGVFKLLRNSHLNIFNTSGTPFINNSTCLFNIANSNECYRNSLSKVSQIKAETIIHVIESSVGLEIFRESLIPLLCYNNTNSTNITTSQFFHSLESTTMKSYKIFREQYLLKSGIISINLLLKVDTKKSQINVFTEQIPPLSYNNTNSTNIARRYFGVIPIESREVENSHSHVFELLSDYRTFHNQNSFTSFYYSLYNTISNNSKEVNRKPLTNITESDYRFTYYARSKKAKITEGLSFLYLQPDANFQLLAKIRVLSKFAVKEKLEDRSVRTQLDGIEAVERMLVESLYFSTQSTNYSTMATAYNDTTNTPVHDSNNNVPQQICNEVNIETEQETSKVDSANITEITESSSDSFIDINTPSSENNTQNSKNNTGNRVKTLQKLKQQKNKRKDFRTRFLPKDPLTLPYPEMNMLHIDVLHKSLFSNNNLYIKIKIIEFLAKYDYQKVISFFIRYFCVENSTIIKPIHDIISSTNSSNNTEDLHLLESLLYNLGSVHSINNNNCKNTVFQLININKILSTEYKIKRSMVIIDLFLSILRYIDSSSSNDSDSSNYSNNYSNGDSVVSLCVTGIMQHEILLNYYNTSDTINNNKNTLQNISSEIRTVLHKIFIYEFINQSVRNQVFVSSINYILYRYIRGEVSLNIKYLIKLSKEGNYHSIRKISLDGILLLCYNNTNDRMEAIKYIKHYIKYQETTLVIHLLKRINGLLKYNNKQNKKECLFFNNIGDVHELLKVVGSRCSDIFDLLSDIILTYNNTMQVSQADSINNRKSDDFVINIKIAQRFPEKLIIPLENTNSNKPLDIANPRLYKQVTYDADDDQHYKSLSKSLNRSLSRSSRRSSRHKSFKTHRVEESLSISLSNSSDINVSLEEVQDSPKKKIKMTVIPDTISDSLPDEINYNDTENIKKEYYNTKERNWPGYKHRLYEWRCKVRRIAHVSCGEVCLMINSDILKDISKQESTQLDSTELNTAKLDYTLLDNNKMNSTGLNDKADSTILSKNYEE